MAEETHSNEKRNAKAKVIKGNLTSSIGFIRMIWIKYKIFVSGNLVQKSKVGFELLLHRPVRIITYNKTLKWNISEASDKYKEK